MTTVRISIDPVACDAYGYCVELLPEAMVLDEWGYPIVDGRPLPADLMAMATPRGAGLPQAGDHPDPEEGRPLT